MWTMVRSEIQVCTEVLLALMSHLGPMYNSALLAALPVNLHLPPSTQGPMPGSRRH